jgi:uncharacterized protein YdeI (YjbR/CyaY-like superfamily)
MNTAVDVYFTSGCGRCPLGNTPRCKVHKWPTELQQLRMLVLESGLTEESKWGVPCYTWQKHNVVVVSAFNNSCTLSFFKGALLSDPHKILIQPGENSQAARVVRFTHVEEIIALEPILMAYLQEAIEIEKAGLKVNFEKNLGPIPEEFQARLDELPSLKRAFEALTPGKQRGYILHFSGSKQSATRMSRIEKCIPLILKGKSLNDR